MLLKVDLKTNFVNFIFASSDQWYNYGIICHLAVLKMYVIPHDHKSSGAYELWSIS